MTYKINILENASKDLDFLRRNDKRAESLLKERFDNNKEMEDEKFLTILKQSHMKDFASKEEIFKVLEQVDDSKL